MIYNLPRKKAKFEETWVLNSVPDWRDFFNSVGDRDGLTSGISVAFISNNIKFDYISVCST